MGSSATPALHLIPTSSTYQYQTVESSVTDATIAHTITISATSIVIKRMVILAFPDMTTSVW